MLKDITLGQYFPGESIVHRVDPRIKLILNTAFVVALFLGSGPISYGIVIAYLALVIGVSGIPPRMVVRGLRPILFIMLFTAFFNLFYTPGTEIWQFGILTVTYEGIQTAILMVVRVMLLIIGTSMLTYTTSPIQLTDGLESLFAPLKKLRLPVHELAMMMSIALRFIPTLIEETDKIMSAQKARGADFESGNLIRRAQALIPILIPLFISAFRRADELATAMECRLYRGDIGRTRMRQLRLTRADLYAGVCSALVFASIITVGRFGW